MITDLRCAFEELTAGHALSALDPVEEETFLLHLPGCLSCAEDVQDFAVIMDAFAFAPQDAEPPARVLAGILAAIGGSSR